jgi:hypothetical protein
VGAINDECVVLSCQFLSIQGGWIVRIADVKNPEALTHGLAFGFTH